MIEVICPRCNRLLAVSEQDIGTTGHCAKCRGHISILDALEPTPREEAPPAPLAADPGNRALAFLLHPSPETLEEENPIVEATTPEVQRECLARILIDLNQVAHLIRYKRNDIPKTKDFLPERMEREKWQEEMGNFGLALFDSNIKWRLDNIRDALLALPMLHFRELRDQLIDVIDDTDNLSAKSVAHIIERAKNRLRDLDD